MPLTREQPGLGSRFRGNDGKMDGKKNGGAVRNHHLFVAILLTQQSHWMSRRMSHVGTGLTFPRPIITITCMDHILFSLEKSDAWSCPCGCARQFPRESGMLHYTPDNEAVFRAHLLEEVAGDPHLWLLLGTGSWIAREPRGSWIAVHSWIVDGELIARIQDPVESPFTKADAFDERLLSRDEVFGQPGGVDFVFKCHDLLVTHHPAVSRHLGITD